MKLSDIAKRIVCIDEERSEIRQQDDRLKDERRQLEEQMLEAMADEGVDQLKALGRTVYARHEVWASATDVEALKAFPGTSGLVKEAVNGQTLSAYIRELPRDEEGNVALPDELAHAVNVSQVTKIATRRA